MCLTQRLSAPYFVKVHHAALTCAELIIKAVVEEMQLRIGGLLVHSSNQHPRRQDHKIVLNGKSTYCEGSMVENQIQTLRFMVLL